MDEREKLHEELLKLNLGSTDRPYLEVADFILADRRRIVEPLIQNRDYIKNYSSKDTMEWRLKVCDDDINETLKNAGIS